MIKEMILGDRAMGLYTKAEILEEYEDKDGYAKEIICEDGSTLAGWDDDCEFYVSRDKAITYYVPKAYAETLYDFDKAVKYISETGWMECFVKEWIWDDLMYALNTGKSLSEETLKERVKEFAFAEYGEYIEWLLG